MASFSIAPATDEDFKVIAPLIFKVTGGESAAINAIYPHNLTQEGQAKHIQNFLDAKRADTSRRWIKAVDAETGKIVGAAQWSVYEAPKPSEDELAELNGVPGTWDTEDDKEYAQAIYRSCMEDPGKVIREANGPVLFLYILMVLKEYAGRGIGSALTSWGTELADSIDAECVLQASKAGARIYAKQGFVFQRQISLSAPEKFADRKKKEMLQLFMHRPKRSSAGAAQ